MPSSIWCRASHRRDGWSSRAAAHRCRARLCCPTSRGPAQRHERRRQPEDDDERIALILRLDRARYTRLRILAARRCHSGHDVLLNALDAYLEACATDCACLRR